MNESNNSEVSAANCSSTFVGGRAWSYVKQLPEYKLWSANYWCPDGDGIELYIHFANTMLGECAASDASSSNEPLAGALGETRAVGQNEQTKELCPYCQCEPVGFGGDCGDGSNRCMEC